MDIKVIIKSLGINFWLAIGINDIVIPLIVLLIKLNSTEANVTQGIMTLTQMFTPFLAGFLTYIYLEKYINTKGNECLYVGEKCKLSEVIRLFFVYIVSNTPFFLWYGSMGKKYVYEWIHIVIISFVFISAAYSLSYLLKSTSLAIIPAFLYQLASVTMLNDAMRKISFYEGISGMKLSKLTTRYNYFMVVAILMMVLGKWLNQKYEDYR